MIITNIYTHNSKDNIYHVKPERDTPHVIRTQILYTIIGWTNEDLAWI